MSILYLVGEVQDDEGAVRHPWLLEMNAALHVGAVQLLGPRVIRALGHLGRTRTRVYKGHVGRNRVYKGNLGKTRVYKGQRKARVYRHRIVYL